VLISVHRQSVKFFDKTIILILFPNLSVSNTNHQTYSIAKCKSCHKLPHICRFLKRPEIPGSLTVSISIFITCVSTFNLILIVGPRIFVESSQNNQQMCQESSKIYWCVLNLPQHVLASHCHHQRVVVTSQASQAISVLWMDMDYDPSSVSSVIKYGQLVIKYDTRYGIQKLT
jgi:hypothetical protein